MNVLFLFTPSLLTVLSCLLTLFTLVSGHGRLLEPPSRASMWRVGHNSPPNYNDNELFCGGFKHQWNMNKGKCGACGDPWDGERQHEAGGKYATGIIARKYQQGQTIAIDVELTATHKGYFEFRLCPNNNPSSRVFQNCLDKHVLKRKDGSTRFYVKTSRQGLYNLKFELPAEVTCTQCVLQWKYNTGNSWGCETNGRCCIGCGPQEQFYGCADVAIKPVSGNGQTTTDKSSVPKTPECSAVGFWAGNIHVVDLCKASCTRGICPSELCSPGCRVLGKV